MSTETDRELLELAAKAAGMNLHRYQDGWHYSSDGPRGEGVYKIDPDQSPLGNPRPKFVFWNPLTDDGDAFRLASALHLTVEFGNNMVIHPNEVIGEGMEPLAATRRAIVRAAAEIGKGMLTHDELVLMFPGRFPDEEVERARAAAGKPGESPA